MKVEGMVALVTGAGSGIGRATAQRLARSGALLAVNDINEATALESVRLIEQEGRRAIPMSADVANDGDVRKMITDVRTYFGRLDIVVNNAASSSQARPLGLCSRSWSPTYGVACS